MDKKIGIFLNDPLAIFREFFFEEAMKEFLNISLTMIALKFEKKLNSFFIFGKLGYLFTKRRNNIQTPGNNVWKFNLIKI